MNILDFEVSANEFFDYETVQKVWGKETDISVMFENKKTGKQIDKGKVSLRGIVRPLGLKLRHVEENRAAIEKAVMAANIEGLTESDLKTLEINWVLFIYFVDVEECELSIYLGSQTDVLDGAEIAVTIQNDNTLFVEDELVF